jgi:capsular exopolysaccharide synthesis family protein
MKFLKTLQKRQREQSAELDALDNSVASGKKKRRRVSADSEVPLINDVLIGKPGSTLGAHSAVAAENIDAGFDESRDTEPTFEPAVVATIEPERVNPHLVAVTQPNSVYCEEYRSLRTHILHKSEKQKLQSIVVASVGPSEGKSITALNLSWLLSQTDGIKALIIDSDLRRPCLAAYLGLEAKLGLSDILAGKTTIEETIIRLEPAGLHLLPGGNPRTDVTELLSGPKFRELLSEIRELFDFIIIDAPPLGIFTDANVLINQADGALLVVKANQTRYREVDRVLEMLPRDRLLGAVLNQSEEALMNESYYYYDYYRNSNV